MGLPRRFPRIAVLLLSAAVLLFSRPSTALAEDILVWSGEQSVYYGGLVEAFVEFKKKTGIRVISYPGGCPDAAKGVPSGKVDVGGICCLLKPEEMGRFHTVTVGYKPLAIVVNTANPVGDLTVDQVRKIFSGEITNWKSVGGPDRPVHVVTRLHCQDRQGNWKQILARPEDFTANRFNVKEDQDILLAVAQRPGGIGYMESNMINTRYAKAVKIGGVDPTPQALAEKKYPWKMATTFITMGPPSGKTAVLVEFLRTEGKKYFSAYMQFVE